MNNVTRLFLKFGKKQYLERLRDGNLYFTNAIRLRGIENELLIKGQGDKYEGKTVITGKRLTLGDGSVHNGTFNIEFSLEPANKLPVYCLFTCFDKDCKQNKSGQWIPQLSTDIIDMALNHFPGIDAVAIISNPDQFIQDVKNQFGEECKNNLVKYAPVGDNVGFLNDLVHTEYPGHVSTSYISLFRKDTFFTKEQEYRFVLSDTEIEEPQEIKVSLSSNKDITIQDIDEFIGNMNEKRV